MRIKPEIVQVSMLDDQLIAQISESYCTVWKEPPWSEDFWKTDQVIQVLKDQLAKDESLLLAATVGSVVAGFTLGWHIPVDEVNRRTNNNLGFDLTKYNMFYVSELGTVKCFRNQGIATALSMELIKRAKTSNYNLLILRTHVQAESARKLYSGLGFEDTTIPDVDHPERTYWVLNL